ncbi:hypothetical protein O3M35_004379 [Rhynocoris fuscipes]
MDKFYEWCYNKLEGIGLGYASSLVDIYYYGYLIIVLPTPEDSHRSKGIEDRIRAFRQEEDLTIEDFPVERLFLLVTSSGFAPPDLGKFDFSRNRIEARKNLTLEPVLKRNGVKDRKYKTTVYKIYNKDKSQHVSVVLEAAPCLRTLRDSAQKNPLLDKFRLHIIKTFSERLKLILNEQKQCQNKCVIIFCDEGDQNYNLADDIWEKVKEFEALDYDGIRTGYKRRSHETNAIQTINPNNWYFKYFIEKMYYHLENRGLGYASAMVDNYFYGYLKLVLPDKGTDDMIGIRERIQHFVDDERDSSDVTEDRFPCRKLLLLVTASGYTPSDISEFSKDRIKIFKNLCEEPVISRNGVKRRTYRTTVYQILSRNKRDSYYGVIEGAPCLRQLHEAAKCNPVLKCLRLKIIKQFIFHLKERLKTEDCRNLCEIIFFDDDDLNINLADLILEKMSADN